jgi:hypothetical protein
MTDIKTEKHVKEAAESAAVVGAFACSVWDGILSEAKNIEGRRQAETATAVQKAEKAMDERSDEQKRALTKPELEALRNIEHAVLSKDIEQAEKLMRKALKSYPVDYPGGVKFEKFMRTLAKDLSHIGLDTQFCNNWELQITPKGKNVGAHLRLSVDSEVLPGKSLVTFERPILGRPPRYGLNGERIVLGPLDQEIDAKKAMSMLIDPVIDEFRKASKK